jgi:nucleotide-binding universal stress UspA family protein
MFSRILVPLDGSHLAESVLPTVEAVASASGGSVVLLHVHERGAPTAVHGDRHLHGIEEGNSYLEQIAERLRERGLTVERHYHDVPEGDVVRSIAAHGEEVGADLIILCTHGSGRVRQMLFGSIAQQVLNRGSTPVLLVRPSSDGSSPAFAPERILVPLDGTAAGENALAPAEAMAGLMGSALHLVMVVGTQDSMRGDHPAAALLPSATRAVLEMEQRDATAYLHTLAARMPSGMTTVSTEVRRGSTASALAEEAAEPGVGLVVVATHGRAGVQAIWAGSVIAQLLTRTHAPVLLLRCVEH